MTGEPMLVSDCAQHRAECLRDVHAEIATSRRETQHDISLIREAVQAIDRSVSTVKGFLGLNGGGVDQRQVRRDSEEEEHMHRRVADVIEESRRATAIVTAACEAASKREAATAGDWRVKVMWGVGIFAAGAIIAPILGAVGQAIARKLFG